MHCGPSAHSAGAARKRAPPSAPIVGPFAAPGPKLRRCAACLAALCLHTSVLRAAKGTQVRPTFCGLRPPSATPRASPLCSVLSALGPGAGAQSTSFGRLRTQLLHICKGVAEVHSALVIL